MSARTAARALNRGFIRGMRAYTLVSEILGRMGAKTHHPSCLVCEAYHMVYICRIYANVVFAEALPGRPWAALGRSCAFCGEGAKVRSRRGRVGGRGDGDGQPSTRPEHSHQLLPMPPRVTMSQHDRTPKGVCLDRCYTIRVRRSGPGESCATGSTRRHARPTRWRCPAPGALGIAPRTDPGWSPWCR